MIKRIFILILIAQMALFSAVFNPNQSMNECLYEIHQAENEMFAVLAVGYLFAGDEKSALLMMRQIYEYPHEVGFYNDFIRKMTHKIDKINDKKKAQAYLKKLLQSKNADLNYCQKKCDRLARAKGLKK